MMSQDARTGFKSLIERESEAISVLRVQSEERPITIIGNEKIVDGFEDSCLQQAINTKLAPGVTDVFLNPDAHMGYGAPVGSVLVSPTHIYPGPVGVDIKCSMSLLQTNVPADAIEDRRVRRALIQAICQRVPTGTGRGQRPAVKSRQVSVDCAKAAACEGASKEVLSELGIPTAWAEHCEDAFHRGPDGAVDSLTNRFERLQRERMLPNFANQAGQLGSYGGGNHFGECEVVSVSSDAQMRRVAEHFGLQDNNVAFLSHCGSRGFGHTLATNQFRLLKQRFKKLGLGFPGGDEDLVYAEYGTPESHCYLADMALGANFATVNHLLINRLVLEAFQQVLPGAQGKLVYFISHNIARKEWMNDQWCWVHRKGATRAFPAGHPELAKTRFADVGPPILLPGNPRDGSSVMVALEGAQRNGYSVNHGAGRSMSRSVAKRLLDQKQIDSELIDHDILSNCRVYPRDEAPDAYKDFKSVLESVQQAGLAAEVAKLKVRFVIKDHSGPDD